MEELKSLILTFIRGRRFYSKNELRKFLKIKGEQQIIIPLKFTLNKKNQNMVKFI